jgi:hypothetical protein
MTFKEKIDNILRISNKKFTSVYDLELKSGVGMGTLRKAYDEDREPSKRTIWKVLESIGVNPEWWETGKGDTFLTSVTKPTDNKEKEDDYSDQRAIVDYRTLVEGHTEYVLIPRAVMNEVQLVAKSQLEKDKAYMEALIEFNRDLLTKIPGVASVVKDGKIEKR